MSTCGVVEGWRHMSRLYCYHGDTWWLWWAGTDHYLIPVVIITRSTWDTTHSWHSVSMSPQHMSPVSSTLMSSLITLYIMALCLSVVLLIFWMGNRPSWPLYSNDEKMLICLLWIVDFPSMLSTYAVLSSLCNTSSNSGSTGRVATAARLSVIFPPATHHPPLEHSKDHNTSLFTPPPWHKPNTRQQTFFPFLHKLKLNLLLWLWSKQSFFRNVGSLPCLLIYFSNSHRYFCTASCNENKLKSTLDIPETRDTEYSDMDLTKEPQCLRV